MLSIHDIPFMTVAGCWRHQGRSVNHKRVQRLMGVLGLAGMAPGPATSRPKHKVYPYLLRGLAVTRPNQVWSADITYVRLARGFVYLVAMIMATVQYAGQWFLHGMCRQMVGQRYSTRTKVVSLVQRLLRMY